MGFTPKAEPVNERWPGPINTGDDGPVQHAPISRLVNKVLHGTEDFRPGRHADQIGQDMLAHPDEWVEVLTQAGLLPRDDSDLLDFLTDREVAVLGLLEIAAFSVRHTPEYLQDATAELVNESLRALGVTNVERARASLAAQAESRRDAA